MPSVLSEESFEFNSIFCPFVRSSVTHFLWSPHMDPYSFCRYCARRERFRGTQKWQSSIFLVKLLFLGKWTFNENQVINFYWKCSETKVVTDLYNSEKTACMRKILVFKLWPKMPLASQIQVFFNT